MPDETAIAALEALLHGNQVAVTFRHLSAHLQIPTRQAQALLLSYVTSHSSSALCTLWCVTTLTKCGRKRVSLATTPPADALAKTVWAIGPASFSKTASPSAAWLAADSARELEQQAAPVSEPNALRDGRYNPIQSSTSAWKPSERGAQVTPATKSKPLGASLLASVKAKAKKKNSAKKASPFKPSMENGKNKGGSGLFASKRLGADAASKIKAEEKKKEEKKKKEERERKESVKKARRVIDDSDEEKDEYEDEQQMREMEMQELERERDEQEREELEKEEMERLRQEEVKRELEELNREEDEEENEEVKQQDEEKSEPQSPELKEVEEKNKSPQRTPEKRTLNEAFGLPNDKRSTKRRIRREVQEVVEKDGYMETRMVIKVFDENGNEVEEKFDEKPTNGKDASQPNGVSSPDRQDAFKPLKSANSQNIKNGKLKNGSAKKEKKDIKRPAAKLGATGGTKKTPKKAKGKNIMSYFKKT